MGRSRAALGAGPARCPLPAFFYCARYCTKVVPSRTGPSCGVDAGWSESATRLDSLRERRRRSSLVRRGLADQAGEVANTSTTKRTSMLGLMGCWQGGSGARRRARGEVSKRRSWLEFIVVVRSFLSLPIHSGCLFSCLAYKFKFHTTPVLSKSFEDHFRILWVWIARCGNNQ